LIIKPVVVRPEARKCFSPQCARPTAAPVPSSRTLRGCGAVHGGARRTWAGKRTGMAMQNVRNRWCKRESAEIVFSAAVPRSSGPPEKHRPPPWRGPTGGNSNEQGWHSFPMPSPRRRRVGGGGEPTGPLEPGFLAPVDRDAEQVRRPGPGRREKAWPPGGSPVEWRPKKYGKTALVQVPADGPSPPPDEDISQLRSEPGGLREPCL